MEIATMTVAQVEQFLQQQSFLSPELIEKLNNDKRISIIRLLNKWQKQQREQHDEKIRLHKLYKHEYALVDQGYQLIAGVDEVGRGPLAGPVVVGAVILPLGCCIPGLNDSKQLTRPQREQLDVVIREQAIAYNLAIIDEKVIDKINIYQATVLGMYQALNGLSPAPDAALIDAVPLNELTIKAYSIIDGDAISASIAAASIIAKVARDRIMQKLDEEYPEYGFAHNMGYGTMEHITALQHYGPCPIHRRSFAPVKEWEDVVKSGA